MLIPILYSVYFSKYNHAWYTTTMTIVHMCLFPVMLRTHVFIPSDASYTCVYSQWCFVPPAYKCNITDSYASSNRYMYMLNMSPNQKRVTIQIYSSSASNCLSHNNACSVANLLMYVWGWYSFYDRPIGLNYCVYLSKPSDMCISRHHKKA